MQLVPVKHPRPHRSFIFRDICDFLRDLQAEHKLAASLTMSPHPELGSRPGGPQSGCQLLRGGLNVEVTSHCTVQLEQKCKAALASCLEQGGGFFWGETCVNTEKKEAKKAICIPVSPSSYRVKPSIRRYPWKRSLFTQDDKLASSYSATQEEETLHAHNRKRADWNSRPIHKTQCLSP